VTHPTILFVNGEERALMFSRLIGSEHLLVLPSLRHSGYRASSVIVERPSVTASIVERERWDEWCAWVPTRLAPGRERRIVYVSHIGALGYD
jgi:hypothetical protein